VTSEELVSRSEIAALLNVTSRTVQRYTSRPDFPEPVGRLKAGRVWRRRDVEAWARTNLPLPPGRPPKPR
jgi:prophage regulatory protein